MTDDVLAGEPVIITVNSQHTVSGLFARPAGARALYVLAHGAGAGMRHPFLAAVSQGLGERGIATLRYQFPYMEKGSKRPDQPTLAHATVRAAVSAAARIVGGVPLIAGGKSFGGRMTSQAQALSRLPGVAGLAFLGFPLHPANRPSLDRATHLFDIDIPMLFLQGSRDELAAADSIRAVTQKLGSRATLQLLEHADHSFHVPARSGRKDPDVLEDLLNVFAAWTDSIIREPNRL